MCVTYTVGLTQSRTLGCSNAQTVSIVILGIKQKLHGLMHSISSIHQEETLLYHKFSGKSLLENVANYQLSTLCLITGELVYKITNASLEDVWVVFVRGKPRAKTVPSIQIVTLA